MPESQPPEPTQPPEQQDDDEKAEDQLEDLEADEEVTERVRGGRSRAISIP